MFPIRRRIGPIGEEIQDERSTAVTECRLARRNLGCGAAQVCKLNLGLWRGYRSDGIQKAVDGTVVEIAEIAGLRVITLAVREAGIGHCLKMKERDNLAAHRIRTAKGKGVSEACVPRVRISSPDQRTAGDGPAAVLRRGPVSLWCQAQVDVPLQFEGGVGHEFSPELEQSSNMRFWREPFTQRYSSERM